MLFTVTVLEQFLDTTALLALVALSYGGVMRIPAQTSATQLALGALFGGAAIVAMWDTSHVADGVIVDLRNVPLTLAGAFLGPPGVIAATLMAVMTRIGIGGTGMAAGSGGIVIAALVGHVWATFVRQPNQPVRNALLLAALSQLSMATTLLLPWDLTWQVVTDVWPTLMPLSFVGVFILSTVLKHEQSIADDAKRLSDGTTGSPG